jgi:caa(3)-type oxidase subunit IV
MAAHAHEAFDPADPHHEILHHGHVIIRPRTLVAVLALLLLFTVTTVAASRGEVWFAHKFNVEIPQLVNVLIALSIAVVKTLLVGLFFMQLKYDNPLHSILMLFCLFAVALFLCFAMTDLGTRGVVYAYKSGEIQRGGMGIDTQVKDDKGTVLRGVDTGQLGIVAWARQRRINEIGQLQADGLLRPPLGPGETAEERWEKEAAAMHAAHGVQPRPAQTSSSANRQIKPHEGPTPDLYTPDALLKPKGEEHGH